MPVSPRADRKARWWPTFLFSRFLTFFSTIAIAAWIEVSCGREAPLSKGCFVIAEGIFKLATLFWWIDDWLQLRKLGSGHAWSPSLLLAASEVAARGLSGGTLLQLKILEHSRLTTETKPASTDDSNFPLLLNVTVGMFHLIDKSW